MSVLCCLLLLLIPVFQENETLPRELAGYQLLACFEEPQDDSVDNKIEDYDGREITYTIILENDSVEITLLDGKIYKIVLTRAVEQDVYDNYPGPIKDKYPDFLKGQTPNMAAFEDGKTILIASRSMFTDDGLNVLFSLEDANYYKVLEAIQDSQ